jgi:aldehyde dehydrogenase (NAD+)
MRFFERPFIFITLIFSTDQLLTKIAKEIENMYGPNPQESRFYPRIVNQRAHQRLQGLLKQGTIHTGGTFDENDLYISPTIIDDVQEDFEIMQEEIFGPILPVMTYENINDAIDYINKNEKPLAFYYFGKNAQAKKVLSMTSSGGGGVNDLHVQQWWIPLGFAKLSVAPTNMLKSI